MLRAVTDNASAMRQTAQSITKVASDANGRAVAAASATEQASVAQSIAKELAPLGIRVVNVAPGAVDTPINKSVLENAEESAQVLAEIPLNRWGHVRDIAQAVAWLASDQASYVTGATLFVDGGMTLYPRFI